jgi:hypothetical protein
MERILKKRGWKNDSGPKLNFLNSTIYKKLWKMEDKGLGQYSQMCCWNWGG